MIASGEMLYGPQAAAPAHASAVQHWLQRVFSLPTVFALAVGSLIMLAVPRTTDDPDIWWHLRNAQLMLQNHAFVRHDQFSFTVHGVPWIDHEWLAELPYLLGWRLLGNNGLYLLSVLLPLLIFAAVLLLCRQETRSASTACLITLAAALLSTVSFGPRTLLFGWLLFCVQALLLQRFKAGHTRAVLLLPPLYLVWINLHGSWLLGLGVLLVTALAGQLRLRQPFVYTDPFPAAGNRALLLACCGIVPALFCNPWGWRLVAYPFNFAFHQTLNVASVDEWAALDFHSFRGEVLAASVLLLAARQLWRPRAWALDELLLFAGGLYAACLHARFLFLYALLAAPVVARSFPGKPHSDAKAETPAGAWLVNAALLALLALAVTTNLRRSAAKAERTPQAPAFPTAALPALDRLPADARLFNEFGWGGYLEWTRPGRPVFIDSRVDIFEYNGVLKDYLDSIRIRDTLGVLDRYRIGAVLFEQDTPLSYLLARSPGWMTAWSDKHTVLFVRRAHP